jgi:hypothetical protein
MSKWTGKADFCDWCEMHNNPKEIVEKADVYLGNAKVEIKTEEDLIPYYTNLIGSMGCSADHQNINLTTDSFIDIEEKEFLAWDIDVAIRAARKAKKAKVKFTYDSISDDIHEKSVLKCIVDIINANPDIIKTHLSKEYSDSIHVTTQWIIPTYFSNVHLARFNKMRRDFLDFCAQKGYKCLAIDMETKEKVERSQRHHPLLWKMSMECLDYDRMVDKYGI